MDQEKRLESWKEIEAYLKRDVRTLRRWEKDEGLPIHRHSHRSRSSVYAYPSEIDAWRASRKTLPEPPPLWKTLLTGPLSLAFGTAMASFLIMVGNGVRPQVASAQSVTAGQIPVKGSADAWSFSRDGRLMATTEWDKGGGDLVVQEVATGRDTILQKGACVERGKRCVFADTPLLSPDLKQVAYTWYDDNENDGRGQLRLIANQPGSMPRILVRTAELSTIWPSAWSPDGKSIFAQIRQNDRTWWQIGRIDAANGALTVLKTVQLSANGRMSRLSLSPDGKFIAYSIPIGGNQQVFLLAADGSNEIALTKGAAVNDAPIWMPDGRHVLFTSNQTGRADLWSIEVRAGRPFGIPSVVKRDIGDIKTIDVTASGSLLYTLRRTDTYDTLAEINQAGGNLTLRTTEKFTGFLPGWSADGKSIAFARNRAGRPDSFDLVVRSISTGEERIYSHEGLSPAPPTWSHDGKSVFVAVASKRGDFSFHRLDIASGQFTEAIPADPSYWAFARLSPDDRTLYITSRDAPRGFNGVFAYNLAAREQKLVLSLNAKASTVNFFFGHDGRRLGFRIDDQAQDGKTRFGISEADGTGYREIYAAQLTEISDRRILAWSPDGRSLLFGKPESGRDDQGRTVIMRIPVDGGQPESTGLRISADVRAMVTAEDGSRIVLTSQETSAELWGLDNVTSGYESETK